ncbi:MAG: phosphatidate cytidylyltransferase [Variovorax sp.]|nr:MAG: phosphatidate cytidylyltransferase [Variovorax sp.]
MLKQRILTALVLLAILLPALFYRSSPGAIPIPFACVMLVLIAAAGWEWGKLNGYGQGVALLFGAETFALCILSWALGLLDRPLPIVWTVAGACWVLGAAALLRVGVPGWPRIPKPLRVVGGLLALWVAWLAAVQARMVGVNFLLSILLLVWMADICAYFAGRAFGLKFTRNKLAPSISPGKSWEGVWGGVIGVVVLAVLWVWADAATQATVGSIYTRLVARAWWLLPIGVLFMVAMSVVGDLVESLIKRSAGAKDSSNLLPGHGGVLDRVDALLPTLPIAMMLAFT